MRLLLAFLLAFAYGGTCLADDGLTPAQDLYRTAIAHMREIVPPPYLTYRTQEPAGASSLGLVLLGDAGARAFIQIGDFRYPETSWAVAFRGSDSAVSIAIDPNTHVVSSLALFDPTWNGASLWMRHGLLATTHRVAVTTSNPGTTPQPSGTDPPTIAVVHAFDASGYRIEDGGPARCESRRGRLLLLYPMSDPADHPLQRVVVDDATGRFCAMRFALAGEDQAATYHGYVELHFADEGAYYLIDNGFIDVHVFQNGASVGFARIPFRYTDMAFPKTLPDALFAQP